MNRLMNMTMGGLTLLAMTLAGCSTGNDTRVSGSGATMDKAAMEEGAVYHNVTEADKATTHGTTPIAGEYVKLWINGMGCPQCVTNVDLQLERQFGATGVRVDLESGVVYARFPSKKPTPDQLATAIGDAGVTLAKVQVASMSLEGGAGAM